MTVLTVLALSLFISLGYWQLQRAQEKTSILANYQTLMQQASLPWDSAMELPKQFQAIHLEGSFLQTNFLLDNQYHRHQFGYDVITPLELKNGQIVLIDRGWIQGDPRRLVFPHLSIPSKKEWQGTVYYPSSKAWVLGEIFEKKRDDLIIIETIDTKFMSKFLHKTVYPFIIRLNEKEAQGFLRDWPLVAMPPEKHKAYALQWFVMAFVVVIIFIGLHLNRKTHDEKR